MALEKNVIVDKIEVLEMGQIQVRTATIIIDNGKEIPRTFHRHVINPGDNITEQNERVQAIANAIWNDKVISDYTEMIKSSK